MADSPSGRSRRRGRGVADVEQVISVYVVDDDVHLHEWWAVRMRHVVPVPRLSRETKGFVVDMRLHRPR
ncbi:unnamed protein product (mitochondrion) [Plasmodiophora brassicae]|uniref:Uncharacterized protein n=1 Tax=Plasmodiophora brassicae TaxID=37360 RepID=A0A3P3YAF0_PLABS|nr:unnamed protein product [Plasmodiophora brassicae]